VRTQDHSLTAQTHPATVSRDATLNSSLTLTTSRAHGLTLTAFVSNGTDVLASPLASYADPEAVAAGAWHAQLLPTLLYVDEGAQAGERWRMLIVPERERAHAHVAEAADPWDEHCHTDVDPASYAGEPLNELVFWDEGDGKVVEVELPAFRVRLRRQVSVKEDEREDEAREEEQKEHRVEQEGEEEEKEEKEEEEEKGVQEEQEQEQELQDGKGGSSLEGQLLVVQGGA